MPSQIVPNDGGLPAPGGRGDGRGRGLTLGGGERRRRRHGFARRGLGHGHGARLWALEHGRFDGNRARRPGLHRRRERERSDQHGGARAQPEPTEPARAGWRRRLGQRRRRPFRPGQAGPLELGQKLGDLQARLVEIAPQPGGFRRFARLGQSTPFHVAQLAQGHE